MEKYCSSCGAVFNNLKFELCPYCGNKLDVRYGRQPIPRQLRHKVFKRDGYRCRECGASKDETSLEIDHIVPVARGGTNDINNLQTLSRECNRMKHTDEWVGGETDLEIAQNELKSLLKQLSEDEIKLTNASNEDDKIEYQFRITKLKENISKVNTKIRKLEAIEKENKKQQIENDRVDKLFKKLYITLNYQQLQVLKLRFPSDNKSKDDIIRHIAENSSEDEINEIINENFSIQKDSFEANRKNKLYKVLSRNLKNHEFKDLEGVYYYYDVAFNKERLIKLLINSFDTEEEIYAFINKRNQMTKDFLKDFTHTSFD